MNEERTPHTSPALGTDDERPASLAARGHVSYWRKTSRESRVHGGPFPAHVEVAVVGGGITGVTLGYLLAREGKSVALVERGRIGAGDTGSTTAHLTAITDTGAQELVARFGRDRARAVWEVGRLAIDSIERIATDESIDCDLARVPAYVWTDREDDVDWIEEEADAAGSLGFDARLLRPGKRPFGALAALVLGNQAKFHPLRYVRRLAERFVALGGLVVEEALVAGVNGKGPFQLELEDGRELAAEAVVEAAHQPLGEHVLLQSKLLPFQSYAIGALVPEGAIDAALYYDTDEPYHYLRVERRDAHDYAILGGEDLRTGTRRSTELPFARLEDELARLLPPGARARVVDRWSGEYLEPVDGIPYIGETRAGRFVATGFSGNGMTFGTYAAHLLCDLVLGRESPDAELFSPARKPYRNLRAYLKQGLAFPWAFFVDRLTQRREPADVERLAPGEGVIVNDEGTKVAVSRDASGNLVACSAVCTHMKCLVSWNGSEKTWDCRCHGSRFEATGEVRAGPASAPLERLDVPLGDDEAREAA